jgi:hypothetical protein
MPRKGLLDIGAVAWALLAAAFVLTAPRTSHAEQFVLFDALFTYTKMEADTGSPNKSHVYIRDRMVSAHPLYLVLNPKRPTNWTTPVDYRNGTVHVRTEVIDKPAGSEITQWVLCYIPNRGIGPGYGCTGSGTYTEKGLYEHDDSMTSWWQNTAIDWTMGIQGMDLVMKDSNGSTGFTYLRPDFEKFFPTTMRITMIQVSAGSKYDPALLPGLDGGTAVTDSGTRDDSGMVAEASVMEDTGTGALPEASVAPDTNGSGGQTAGTSGLTTSGSGGGGTGSAQGTAGAQGSTGAGSATTGAGGVVATTMGSAQSPHASGCSLARAHGGSASSTGYAAAAAALLAFWATRRQRVGRGSSHLRVERTSLAQVNSWVQGKRSIDRRMPSRRSTFPYRHPSFRSPSTRR